MRIQEIFKAEQGIEIPYSTLTRLIRRQALREPQRRVGVYVFEPSAEMQHDTSPHRVSVGDKTLTAQCAALVLAYSRYLFIQYYSTFTRFEAKSFLTEAFRFIDGVWIHPDQAKAKKAIAVPLNGDAVAILREQRGKHERYVFTYLGKPVTRANNHAWRKALGRAGIEDFRWHDLRHTWASWHVQAGTPPHALQELGGWSSYEMVRRYAHLGAEHLAGYATNISGPRLVVGSETNLIQSRKTEN